MSEKQPSATTQATEGAGPTSRVRIDADARQVVSLAMVHNDVPLLRSLRLHNSGDARRGAEVSVAVRDSEGTLSLPSVALVDLPEQGSSHVNQLALRMDSAAMMELEERRRGSLEVEVRHAGGTLAQWSQDVAILAGRQWLNRPIGLGMEMLAAHVMPNSPEIAGLLGEVADLLKHRTGDSSVQGYQAGPERADEIAGAVFEAMRNRGIRYANPPASWSDAGQKVRTPEEVLQGRVGTCLDTTVVMAAALEQAGIHPLLWVIDGHSFVGYWREERQLDAIATDETSSLVNQVDLGLMRLVETTMVTDAAPAAGFEAATSAPLEAARDLARAIGVVDVIVGRRNGIVPLPSQRRTESGNVQIIEYRPAEHSSPMPRLSGRAEGATQTAVAGTPVPPRVQQWKNALLDLSLRNRLINFTTRSAVTLTVPDGHLADVEDLVHDGRALTLLASDTVEQVYQARGMRFGRDLPRAHLADLLAQRAGVYTDVTQQAYARQLRSLAYKARTIEEETGANNLYLALGSLVWELDGRPLRSPLILVPVSLRAHGRGDQTSYRLSLDEAGGSTPNYCLLEKVKQTHGLQIPALAEPKEDLSGIDLKNTLDEVRKALASRELPFHVEDTVHLSILQFAKFRLWKDLDEEWETLLRNPLAAHLAYSPTDHFDDPGQSDGHPDLDELAALCPIPADSSQLMAVADGVAGRTFVLEGPPGTGKSQTITNLLARALADGKRVLFVAEKRAALDVVKVRMDAVGLGPFSLDLHDKGSKPAIVRQQIKQALDSHVLSDREGLAAAGEALRSATRSLQRYASRLHEPNGAGLSLYSAHTQRLAVGEDEQALPVPQELLTPAKADLLDEVRSRLVTMAELADPARPHWPHPWGFVRLDAPPEQWSRIVACSQRITSGLTSLPSGGRLGAAVHAARNGEDLAALSWLTGSPRAPVALLDETRTDRWRQATSSLRAETATLAATTHPGLDRATPQALDLPLTDLHAQAQAAAASSWFGRKRRLRVVAEQLTPGLKAGVEVPHKEVPELTQSLLQVQSAVRALAERVEQVPGLRLPSGWNPLTEEGRQQLDNQVEWLGWAGACVELRQDETADFKKALRDVLSSEERVDSTAEQALREVAQAVAELTNLVRASDQGVRTWAGEAGFVARWTETEPRRRSSDDSLVSLDRWVALRAHLRPLLDADMTEAHDLLLTGQVQADESVQSFERGKAQASVVERQAATALDLFDATAHQRTIDRFTRCADTVRDMIPHDLQARILATRTFSTHTDKGQIGALRRELGKERRGLAVRPLLQKYGELITQIMPCVLVSPDSLARFFPARAALFDIVVFDEASQVRVADAIGAIGRANSVVVVGDSKQMPPTSFAESSLTTGEDEEEVVGASLVVEDQESILSESVLARVARHWLSWHYRSQDESLIAFSNHHYYDGRLSSFPAPTSGTADPGLRGHGINLVRVDGTFHRTGKGKLLRTNPVEAQAIVADLVRRFDTHAGQGSPSVGVVTFNQQQRAHLETLIRDHDDPRLAESLDSTEEEGLFIKNLENVQGDERDVILFSTAFSVNDKGVLPLNFGPLNRDGGERRLNVAVTRARRQVLLYSSFDPGQLRADETTSLGIKHLRAYLDLAATGTQAIEEQQRQAAGVDRHRESVAVTLRGRGLAVTTDVGLSDFRIDLAVSVPEEPERRVMAVILDGPGWARRRTVGDRDGLPVQVLGDMLGWPAVTRIWLPEWLADPERVTDDLVALVRSAAASGERERGARPRTPATDVTQHGVISQPAEHEKMASGLLASPESSTTPRRADSLLDRQPTVTTPSDSYNPAEAAIAASDTADQPLREQSQSDTIGLPQLEEFRPWEGSWRGPRQVLDRLPHADAARQVREVVLECVEQEGPVHRDRLARGVAASFGLGRVNKDRAASILRTVPEELRCRHEPDFYVTRDLNCKQWRGYRGSDFYDRPVEHIALREMANAMAALCVVTGGMERDELLRETLAAFGGQRLTEGIRKRVQAGLDFALQHGLVTDSQGTVLAARDIRDA